MGMATDEIAHNFEYAGTALRNLSRVAISVMKDNQPSALAQMWLPIFEQNKGPILEAHQRFKKHFSEFMELVENEDFDGLEKKLSEAKTFRDGFDDPERRETRETIEGEKEDLKKIPPFDAKEKGQLKNLFTRKSCPATATNLILPIVIAYAQTMSAKEIDAHFISLKANPSFRDGTHPVTYDSGYVTGLIKSNMPALKELSEDFQNKLSTLTDAIHESDKHIIEEFILLAQNNRNKMPPPRKNNDVRNSFENDR